MNSSLSITGILVGTRILKRLHELFKVNFRCHYEVCMPKTVVLQTCCLVSVSQKYLVGILDSYSKQEGESGRFPFEKV